MLVHKAPEELVSQSDQKVDQSDSNILGEVDVGCQILPDSKREHEEVAGENGIGSTLGFDGLLVQQVFDVIRNNYTVIDGAKPSRHDNSTTSGVI